MNVSRRFFIGGISAFGALGAFGGARFLPGTGKRGRGEPKLRLGVLSDIHVTSFGRDRRSVAPYGDCQTFRCALEWFRDRKADGVVIAGDMADGGVIEQLEAVASTWDEVFPNGKAPDGRPVERLFVFGNHDMGGVPFARGCLKGRPDDEIAKQIIYTDPKAAWERVFHEAYAPIWHKTVRGYSVVGTQWLAQGAKGRNETFNNGIADFYSRLAPQLDPKLPFFHIQHPHPKGTCHGSVVWGQDNGASVRTLSRFPNAVALSGHSHTVLTDPRFLWQGEFTSIGTGSLLYTDLACDRIRYANMRNAWDSRMGMLVSVYDDCMAVRRREFVSGLDFGDELVLPLPTAEARPFGFAEHARRLVTPEFAAGTEVAVRTERRKNRRKKGSQPELAYRVSVRPPTVAESARFCRLEFAVCGKSAGRVRNAISPQTFYPRGHKKAVADVVCLFPASELPKEPFRFRVTPIDGFGKRGGAVMSKEIRI